MNTRRSPFVSLSNKYFTHRSYNLSSKEFCKKFAVLYRKHKLNTAYGWIRRSHFQAFLKEMRNIGYYSTGVLHIHAFLVNLEYIQFPTLPTCDKFWERLKPSRWDTKARIEEWTLEDMLFFQKVTGDCGSLTRKTNKRRSGYIQRKNVVTHKERKTQKDQVKMLDSGTPALYLIVSLIAVSWKAGL